MTTRHPIVLIAAVARNGVIGRAGGMPWHLPSDLAHFRASTMGRPLVIGRKTFAALGRPLPGRAVIVVSHDPGFAADGVLVAPSIAAALEAADAAADERGSDRIMIGGGATLYRALIGVADELTISAVGDAPPGDTLFPPIDPALWQRAERRGPFRAANDSASYSIERWARHGAVLLPGSES